MPVPATVTFVPFSHDALCANSITPFVTLMSPCDSNTLLERQITSGPLMVKPRPPVTWHLIACALFPASAAGYPSTISHIAGYVPWNVELWALRTASMRWVVVLNSNTLPTCPFPLRIPDMASETRKSTLVSVPFISKPIGSDVLLENDVPGTSRMSVCPLPTL